MNKIKLNDEVVVIAGAHIGKKGKILSLNRKTMRAVVEGVGEVKKAVKPTQENPQGGFVTKSLSLHVSNLAIYSAKTNGASRVGIQIDKNGIKARMLKKCGSLLK